MNQLPEQTIRLITSGQVITSVSAIVKELVENSIDAGATSVDVRLDDFGLEKLEVQDNGCGLTVADACVMCKPHYTSKISDQGDLLRLQSYGFRGEALHSLCAVASVTVVSKTRGDATAAHYVMDSRGDVQESKPVPGNVGTSVIVTDLFKNIPVRRQRASSWSHKKTEIKKVKEIVMELGLICPKLKVSLKHNRSLLWQKYAVESLRECASAVYGIFMFKDLAEVAYKSESAPSVEVYGFVPSRSAAPSNAGKSSGDKTKLFVNSRPVVLPQVNQVLKELYSAALGLDSPLYPVAFLSIKVDAAMIDVNVEPNKRTLLFDDMDHILSSIREAVGAVYLQTAAEPPCLALDKNTRNNHDNETSYISTSAQNDNVDSPVTAASSPPECGLFSTPDDTTVNIKYSLVNSASPVGVSEQRRTTLTTDAGQFEKSSAVCNMPSPSASMPLMSSEDKDNFVMDIPMEIMDDDLYMLFESHESGCGATDNRQSTPDFCPGNSAWSRGIAPIFDRPNPLQPVAILRPDQAHGNSRRPADESNSVSSVKSPFSSNKRQLLIAPQRSTAPCPSPHSLVRPPVASVTAEVDLEKIKARLNSTTNRTETSSHHVTVSCVGQLADPFNCLVMAVDQKMHLVNPCRLQEVSLFDNMMSNHRVAMRPLAARPMRLDLSVIPLHLMAVLHTLSTESRLASPSRFVSDHRLVANGFDIRLLEGESSKAYEITALPGEIPAVGITDLIALLSSIEKRPDVALCDCRPLNVIAYLKAEAVRISRKSTVSQDRDIAAKRLTMIGVERLCLHARPLACRLHASKLNFE